MRQPHAASRKWFSRAMTFLNYSNKGQTKRADEYLARFRRQIKFALALNMVICATKVVGGR